MFNGRKDLQKEPELSTEELIKVLNQQSKKLIVVRQLPEDIEKKLKIVLNDLEALKNEVDFKIKDISLKSQVMQDKVEDVNRTGKLKLKEEDKEKLRNSSMHYTVIFQDILSDMINQQRASSFYFSEKRPNKLIVSKSDPDDFVEYMLAQIKVIRKYIKNITKNVNIFFSRYQVNFESEMKNLEYLKQYLKLMNVVKE